MNRDKFKRIKTVNAENEKQILTGLIVDNSFCIQVLPIIRIEYLKLDYAKPLLRMISDYFEKYQRAPSQDLQPLFEDKRKKMEPAMAENIEFFLDKIASEYETAQFNTQYQIDSAKRYLKERHYLIRGDKTKKLIDAGRINEVDELYQQDAPIEADLSRVYNPYDMKIVDAFFAKSQDEKYIFRLPGALGELSGGFQRNNLIAIQAPEKTGKTWVLQFICDEALYAGLKVMWFSYEMSEDQTLQRIYSKTSGTAIDERGFIDMPVFDCRHNQEGICSNKKRTNRINNLRSGLEDGEVPVPEDFPDYKACTACRGTSEYIPAIWREIETDVEVLNKEKVVSKIKYSALSKFKNNLRVVNNPMYKTGFPEVRSHLNIMAETGFVPDVLIMDYLDIMERPPSLSERDGIFKNWREAKGLAGELNIVMFTADQADAAARNQKSVKRSNFTDDKRKDSVLDIKIALNQDDQAQEKDQGLMRISVLYNRMNPSSEKKQVMVLQCFEKSQSMLDCELWPN